MKVAVLFLVLVAFAFAFDASFDDLVVMEKDTRSGVPAGWKIIGQAPRDQEINLLISMKSENLHELDELLMQVSTPSSLDYGKYWSKDQVDSFLAPPQAHLELVYNWLDSHGISKYENLSQGRFISVTTTITQAENLLSVKYHELSHTSEYTVYRSIKHYSIPQSIAEIIEIVGGVTRFPKIKRNLENVVPGGTTTPEIIQKMYNITIPSSSVGNLQAVASFLDQFYSPDDLATFEKEFALPNEPITQTYGPNDASNPGVEASLDVQYLLGVGNCSVETWVLSTADTTPTGNEPFLTFLAGLGNLTQIPYLISISYQDYEYTVSEPYTKICNREFMAYSMQGTTFITGSGDWGVGCISAGQCRSFTSDFPSSSPYVISTGATTFNEQGLETGVSFSSGGFSNYFERPSFQDTAVNGFLSQPTLPPTSYYNSGGRAFPDISTIGTGFVVYINGRPMPVGGTSAATPTFGSMLSMINSMRISAGQPVLGYALPFIYGAWESNPASFLDITTGQPQDEGCCGARFETVAGWDPYTGLGTPNFGILSSLAMSSALFPTLA